MSSPRKKVAGSTPTQTSTPGTGSGQVSTDATCGGTNGFTCQSSTFGNCCSVAGWCGSTSAYCGEGCQSSFGTCDGGQSGTEPTSVAPVSTPTPSSGSGSGSGSQVSTDGTCGSAAGGATCAGSEFGDCCSQYGWCGSTDGHCGAGCLTAFGTCN